MLRRSRSLLGAVVALIVGGVTLTAANAQSPGPTPPSNANPVPNPVTAVAPGDVPITPAVHACKGETARSALPVTKGTLRDTPGRENAATPFADTAQQVRQDFGPECSATFDVARDPAASRFDPNTPCTFEIVTTKGAQGLSADVKRVGDCAGVALHTTIIMPPPTPALVPGRTSDSNNLADFADRLTTQLVYTTPRRDARIIGYDVVNYPMWINYVDAQFQYDGSTVGLYWWQYNQIPQSTWTVSYASPGAYAESSFSYLMYNYVHFHSCGFPHCGLPDVDSWSQPSIRGYGSGYVACSFWESWSDTSPYPNLHTGYYCYDW